eukprot:Clim_evm16s226 gene=Clim_evmTU16s226
MADDYEEGGVGGYEDEFGEDEEFYAGDDDIIADAYDNNVVTSGQEPKDGAPRLATTRTTTKYLTKYERARVLGTRALQLSMSAPPMVHPGSLTDPLEIAMLELKERKCPLIIRRYLPDGSYEDWKVSELYFEA